MYPENYIGLNKLSYIWALLLICLATLCSIEHNVQANLLLTLLFIFDPSVRFKIFKRISFLILGLIFYFFGPGFLPVLILIWSLLRGSILTGILVSSICLLSSFIQPQITLFLSNNFFSINSGSFSFLILPTLIIFIVSNPNKIHLRIVILLWPILIFILSLLAVIGGWWNQNLLASNWIRILLVSIPILIISINCENIKSRL